MKSDVSDDKPYTKYEFKETKEFIKNCTRDILKKKNKRFYFD